MEPIAIVGYAFKLPQGIEDESSLWEVLEQGRSVMTEWPANRVNVNAFSQTHVGRNNTLPSAGAHFLSEDPTVFDAPFFSISSKEAASMDPQQRMLLETSYHALENAGIPVESVAGTETGVFSGSMESDYHRTVSKDPDEAPNNTATGASVSILSNRLSWYFDLKGPSMQLNTACSSSMIAVDLACQSLRSGQSSMALVTGSNIMLGPELSLYLANMNMLSADGLSYSFDHRANGYSRGEGVIVLVLKTLTTAIRNKDKIRAIIRGTGSNQDGRTPGITQPSSSSQETLIRHVYTSCNIDLKSTRYVEAHGTGTQIGDSTEMKALGSVFRQVRSPRAPLYVGSIKSNIGHLEGGSGLAGILKCALILEKGIIPPNALFEKLNAKINAKRNNLQVPDSCISWPDNGLRRASVNSFGFGGSNAHAVMDDAYHTLEALNLQNGLQVISPPADTESNDNIRPIKNGTAKHANGAAPTKTNGTTHQADPNYQLLVYSARDEDALKRVLERYSSYYDTHIAASPEKLRKLAYTLSSRRSLMTMRSFSVGDVNSSSESIGIPNSECVRSSLDTQLCFVFTGQGAQYTKMGLDLILYPVFMTAMREANKAFQSFGSDWSLFGNGEFINSPQFSQPLCTALQIALVDLLRSFGVSPSAVVGHSSGEIAAAYAIGALSLESACKIAFHRGRLSGQLAAQLASSEKSGAMMSVNIRESEFRDYVDKFLSNADIHVACVNSPSNITVAGLETDIDVLKYHLDDDGIFAQKIKTGIAYHTSVMEQIASEYLSSLESLEDTDQEVTATLMVSSVTGQKVSSAELARGQYWVDNLTSPVRFVDAIQYLSQAAPKLDNIKDISDYIEIGPHGALRRPIMDTLAQLSNKKASKYASVLSKLQSPRKTVMQLAGHLFTRGYPVSLAAVNQQPEDVTPSLLSDTPPYPFDRTQKYWYESRLSRDWRLRGSSPRNVLGIRATDWNPLEPRWRKMLSIEEMPWVADHVVDGAIVFPAAGSVVMALEAVRQTVLVQQEQQKLSGFIVKSATFASPIFVEPEKKTEVVTQLRGIQHAYDRSSLRFEVVIFSVGEDGTWTECFKSVVHAQVQENTITEVDGGREVREFSQSKLRNYEQAKLSCKNEVPKQHFYEWLDKQSLSYGEAFALAEDIFWDGNEQCVARVNNAQELYEGVVHPTVLDTCFQLCSTAPSSGMTNALSTFIPHQMRDTWISATGWQHPDTSSVRMKTQSKLNTSLTGINCSVTILNDDGSLLCHARHVGMSAVANKTATDDDQQKRLLHSYDWQPQLSLLSKRQLSEYCKVDDFYDDENFAIDYCVRLETALRTRLGRILPDLKGALGPDTPEYFRRYVTWIERQLNQKPNPAAEAMNDEQLDAELATLRKTRPSWRIFIEVLQNLTAIIKKETDALQLLFSTPLAQDLYDEFFVRTCNHKFISYLELASHQTPDQRILEVGAGTGGWTNQVLKILSQVEKRTGGTAFSEYVYTDISPAYFEGARERFAEYGERMSFKTFDLEQDITATLEPGTFDMILAGSVIHATKNLSKTLSNLRRALKPGGQLIFLETTAPECFVVDFGFGILPGWWCGEEESRAWGPTMTESEWDVLLKESGYLGNDMVIKDYRDDRAHYVSIIVASADTPSHTATEESKILVVVNDQGDKKQKMIASGLSETVFNSSAYRSTVLSISQIADSEVHSTDKVIFLADIGESLLADPSEDSFKLIHQWIQNSKELLWVTVSNNSLPEHPYAGIKDGFLRVVRTENDNKRIISLSLEDDVSDNQTHLQHIAQVYHTAFELKSPDLEYIVREGKILTARLILESELNKDLTASINPQTRQETWLPGPPLKLEVGTRGSLDTLRFVEDEERAALEPTEIEIEIKAFAIGFRDVFSALGRLDENEFGTDCAGVVKRVGSGCTALRPGDRVCTSSFGCMRTHVHCDEADAFKLPDTLTMEEACGVINPIMTAWYSLVDVGRLRKGEKILIHAASGSTGQAAIQVAQMIGAEVYATVGYDHKKQLLIDDYGIPSSHIFYSRDLSFADGVMRMTEGYGVDMVLNSLVGEGLRASWECIAPYGRFIEMGKADINSNTPLPMSGFARNVSFSAVDLRHLTFSRKDQARDLFFTTMNLVKDGVIHCPKPWHTYSVAAIEDAFRYLQSGKSTGRVVVKVEHSAKVQKHLISRRTCAFDPKATYLIAAGLGGVGRSILRWMALRGARKLLVPSRSGAASQAAMTLVKDLASQGVKIETPKCDLSVPNAVQELVSNYTHMGQIRGCINASMVLQDSVFENMTHSQWQTTIRSKVNSSWNLHNSLPQDLDFFILLSSAAGVIGNAGQSNYAAGCTFQDSLTRFRSSKGLKKSVSIDLGPMRTVGAVAEHEGLKRNFEKYPGLALIEEEEFLTLLDILCDSSNNDPRSSGAESQVTMGIITPSDFEIADGADLPLEHLHRSLFAYFNRTSSASNASASANTINAALLFRQASSIEEKTAIVLDSLVRKIARALSIKAEDVDVEKPLHLYGVDSLVAVELRNWIAKEFAAEVPVFELMSGKSVGTIGGLVVRGSKGGRGA
ncbi:polyketide synthase PksD [Periconia macrospinosa]|uniref:Polyketide synthase PksD n=1 Tax=Periconia macrospinosa TaxID=97972 RepID=A0A2V1DQD1_9PLEO|nr:polyketide synthase PksD [Periconia macrospinosa]